MDVEQLSEKKEEESQSKINILECSTSFKMQVFTSMPCEHYLIVAQLVLSAGAEDVPNAQQVKTLIKDIWDLNC
ncbi:putative DNA replication complex GINS protein PSF2 [Armadillidium vulgare]|nr:putative DNA replication complex GINS protein PSF2 [Armadillidium vulgare]